MAISNSPAYDSDPGHLTTPVHLPIDEVAIGTVVAGVEGAEPLALPVGGHSAANLSSLILSYLILSYLINPPLHTLSVSAQTN